MGKKKTKLKTIVVDFLKDNINYKTLIVPHSNYTFVTGQSIPIWIIAGIWKYI